VSRSAHIQGNSSWEQCRFVTTKPNADMAPTRDDASQDSFTIQATLATVMPSLGLAFVTDGQRDWGVTRSMLGARFDALKPGLNVQLLLQQHHDSTLVSDCLTLGAAP